MIMIVDVIVQGKDSLFYHALVIILGVDELIGGPTSIIMCRLHFRGTGFEFMAMASDFEMLKRMKVECERSWWLYRDIG